jgi:hypothetical protein
MSINYDHGTVLSISRFNKTSIEMITKDFFKKNWPVSLCVISIWTFSMFLIKIPEISNSAFWNSILLNTISGIPLGLLTGWLAGVLYAEVTNAKKYEAAQKFYSKFVGHYKEYKVVTSKRPEIEWEKITIELDGLDLVVKFLERADKPTNLKATLRLYGNVDCRVVFESPYIQDSLNGFDEGYWGKYEISIYEDAYRGHKTHTRSIPNEDGRIEYFVTRIIWRRFDTILPPPN